MKSRKKTAKPSTKDANIEFGRRRYRYTFGLLGAIGTTLFSMSFPEFNDSIAGIVGSIPRDVLDVMRFSEKNLSEYQHYGLPTSAVLLLMSSLSGFLKKTAARRRIKSIKTLKKLQSLDWREFEEILADYYYLKGYRVTLAGGSGGGGDGGIDLILRKFGKKTIVQAKRYSGSVGVSVVREMFGVMQHLKGNQVFICTTSTFTADGLEFIKGKPIKLYSGSELFEMFRKVL